MNIYIRKLSLTLSATIFILVLIHTVIVLYGTNLQPELFKFVNLKFNLENEANIPTWFSSTLFLLVSMTALILACIRTERTASKLVSNRLFWAITGAVFGYLSLDELAQLHEAIDLATNYRVKWVTFYAPFAICFMFLCVYYIGFVQQKKPLRYYFLGGLALIAISGIGLEALDYYVRLPYAIRNIVRTSEEALEMLGATLILTGSLNELGAIIEKKWSQKE